MQGGAHVQIGQRWKGSALKLTGQADFVTVEVEPTGESGGETSQLAITGWVSPVAGCDGYVISKGGFEETPFYIHIRDIPGTEDDQLSYLVRSDTGTASGTVLFDRIEQWSHLHLAFDETQMQDNVKLFIDGSEVDSKDLSGKVISGPSPVVLGSMLGEVGGTFSGYLDEVTLMGWAMPEVARQKERTDLLLDLPFTSEEVTSDQSVFGHAVWLLYPEVVDGALEFDTGDSVHVFPNDVFADLRDAFTLEFDLRHGCDAGSVIEFGGEGLFGLGFGALCSLEVHVGNRATEIDYGPYQAEDVHVVFRFDRSREAASMHPGELVIGPNTYALPFSYSFAQYQNLMLYIGCHPNDSECTSMRLSNLKLYRRWVE